MSIIGNFLISVYFNKKKMINKRQNINNRYNQYFFFLNQLNKMGIMVVYNSHCNSNVQYFVDIFSNLFIQ